MTTIVYSHKHQQIAADGRTTNGFGIVSDTAKKWFELNGYVLFMSGSVCNREVWEVLLRDGKFITDDYYFDSAVISVKGDTAFLMTTERCGNGYTYLCMEPLKNDMTIGSGGDFASSYMDITDSTPVDAVRYAAKRDHFTGGAIALYDISTGEITVG